MTRQQRKDRKSFFWNVATITTFGGFTSALVLGLVWTLTK